jgi:hypothetical protein
MEFRTPPRSAVAIVQPLAEPNADISDSHDALAKADRLEVAAVSNETPKQAVLIDDIATRIKELQPSASNRSIVKMLNVDHQTINNDLAGESSPHDKKNLKHINTDIEAAGDNPLPSPPSFSGARAEGIALPEDISIGSSEPPRPIAHHRHNPKSKKVTTAARPKSEPKATAIKRTAISQRSRAASDTEPCRLKAFGGLRKALNSTDCEI